MTFVRLEMSESHPSQVVDESGAGRDETVDLQVGAQHLLQYNVVRGLLDEGCVALI